MLRSADLTAATSLALLAQHFRHLRVLDLGAATGLSAPPAALLDFATRGLCSLRHLCLSFCQDLSCETLLALLWHAPGASWRLLHKMRMALPLPARSTADLVQACCLLL